ncbi:helix-turn-helix domain-containing protein [Endozoicomonas lisbonensis]|uniref:Transcriptional regulator with XRE-family HTH domain n=1 Tax=Endozoicomonas lisbonensis TaxID=3120522 RepID=A0ABV2SFG1_9GAMM
MYKKFPLSLRVIIRQRNWDDQDLAEEVGVDKSTVSRWLSGEQEPKNLTELVNLADRLGITTDELLGRKPTIDAELEQLITQLPEDIQQYERRRVEATRKRLKRLLEDYRKT